MKVALLISGYLRTFKTNISNIEQSIIEKFDDVDTYIHITKHENEDDKYLNPSNIYDDIKFINDRINPISLLVEDNVELDDFSDGLVNTWLKFYKLNELKKINEGLFGDYDLIIKCRPDLNVFSDDVFGLDLNEDIIYIPEDSKIDKDKLRNISDSYICDVFAFGNSKSMDEYFSIYQQLPKLIDKYGTVPETILYNYLKEHSVSHSLVDISYEVILSKCNVFAICGDSGSGKSTLSTLLKNIFSNSFTLEGDRYHKWDRSNNNWKDLTHLNPDANYITKMNEDVFNLKFGNEIHQVDYDHGTGKFTEKQLINPSDNLIVCGLHSLYNDNDSIYDLKIFMDTDEKLKKKWKVKRDVKERGYSVEKVLDSIKKREGDFVDYISPQKNNADLIIKFFTTEEIDLNDLGSDNKLSLELSVTKNLNVSNILQHFKSLSVDVSVTYDENFTIIRFMEYKELDLGLGTNSFYDYILYFILNL